MNELKKTLGVLSLVIGLSSAIMGLSFLVYNLIEKEKISLMAGICILLFSFLGILIAIIQRAKK